MTNGDSHQASYQILMITQQNPEALKSGIFAETLLRSPIANSTQVVCSGKAGIPAIQNPTLKLSAIYLDPLISSPGALKLLNLIRKNRPVTPVHFLKFTDKKLFDPIELERLTVQDELTYSEFQKHISRYHHSTHSQWTDQMAALPALARTTRGEISSEGYQPVEILDFFNPSPCPFDVSIRLSANKYLKILSAQDVFTEERLKGYLSKGVRYLYIRKETHERCLGYCDILAKFILTRKDTALDLKLIENLNQAQEVITEIQSQGLSPAHVDFALAFTGQTQALAKEIAKESRQLEPDFFTTLESYDHAVACSMIAGLIALALEIDSDEELDQVGLSAYFHDIGLYQIPELTTVLTEGHSMIEDESKLTTAQIAAYHTHPDLSAQILGKIPSVPIQVIQAIRQHHERRNRTGFPNRIPANLLSRTAEIVGLADEYIRVQHLTKSNQKTPSKLTAIQLLEKTVFPGFSYAVVDAFKKIFINRNGFRPKG